jgi:hypothetical protein
VRLEGHDSRRNASVLGLVFKYCEHRLMAAVNSVKIANGQRAGLSQSWVLMAAKNFHEADYRFLVAHSPR